MCTRNAISAFPVVLLGPAYMCCGRVRACLALSTLGLPWHLFSESSRSVMPLLFKIVMKKIS